jgi:hypothetical protein
LDVGREVLRDNAFAAGQFPDLGDSSYARNINQAYGVETGETVLGYVPAEGADRDATTPDRTGRAPAASGIGAVRIDPQARFDPAAIKTVEGVVTAVGKSMHAGEDADILLLQIRTDAGDTINVHAGPLKYVSKQDFYAVSGDRVSVTGSPVQSFGHSVLLAARVSKDGRVLTLRNRDGQPVWESGAGSQPESGTMDSSANKSTEGSAHDAHTGDTSEMPAP